MAKYLFGDPIKCTGCRICEIVCSFHKEGVINPRIARLRVERFENGEDKPHTCRQCEHPPCLAACPRGAIYRDKGVVKIDERKCKGLFRCAEACPFGMIIRIPEKKKAVKCDLCGECIRFCPPGALSIAGPMEIARKKRMELVSW